MGGIGLEEILSDLFGAGMPRGRGGPVPPEPEPDRQAELPLTVEEAYTGGRTTIGLGGQQYDVKVPPGVVHGQRIRLPGEGGPGGDLYLVVRIQPHPVFGLDGRDITVEVPITPWEAVLGATVSVPTPGGSAGVVVPAGSSSGRRLRLRGQGMPNPGGAPGDLYAQLRIVVATDTSPTERRLYEDLAQSSSFDPRSPAQ